MLKRILASYQNDAKVERVFSEIGSLISPSRARMQPAQSQLLLVTAEDCRVARQKDEDFSGKGPLAKKMRTAEASAAKKIVMRAFNANIAAIIEKAIEVDSSTILRPLLPRISSTDEDATFILISEEEEREGDCDDAADGTTAHIDPEDTHATDLAMNDFDDYVKQFSQILDGLFSGEHEGSDSGVDFDDGEGRENDSFGMYRMGKLPYWNDKDVVENPAYGFRCFRLRLQVGLSRMSLVAFPRSLPWGLAIRSYTTCTVLPGRNASPPGK